jgi:hypothetical protein
VTATLASILFSIGSRAKGRSDFARQVYSACQRLWLITHFSGQLRVGRSIKARRDLNLAGCIELVLPISFKSLLKDLRRCSLVNFGKLLEGKRVDHTHNIGINGL